MSFRHHQNRHNNQVRFFDDSQASEIDYRTTRFTKFENVTSKPEAPRFPNLHMIFKQKGTMATEEEVIEQVEVVKNRDQEKVVYKTVQKQENVDMEAGEYIKRKRHNLSLQKLNSISAS